MEKVRIVNNGSGKPFDTKVMNAETGEEITSVFKAELTFEASSAPTAVLHMWMPLVDVTLDATAIHYCPLCRREVDEPKQSEEG